MSNFNFSDTSIDLIYGENGIIKSLKDNYIPRPSQIEASNKIFDALMSGNHCIIEGPTGFGKTFAYLIPIFEALVRRDEIAERNSNSLDFAEREEGLFNRVCIVTDGISLQDQLSNKDLPFISKIFSTLYGCNAPTFAVVKGKANFLCEKKICELKMQIGFDKKIIEKISDWGVSTKTGDFAELPFSIPNDILKEISCTEDGECDSTKCQFASSCYYKKQLSKARNADVVIINYHFFFSNIKTNYFLLPQSDIYVFDEAHNMTSIYRDFSEVVCSTQSVRKSRAIFTKAISQNPLAEQYFQDTSSNEVLSRLQSIIDSLSLYIGTCPQPKDKYQNFVINDNSNHFPEPTQTTNEIKNLINKLDVFHDDIQCDIENEIEEETVDMLYDISNICENLKNNLNKNLFVLNAINSADKNNVVYLEIDGDRSKLAWKSVKVAEQMYDKIFSKTPRCILTSATLSINGNFDFIKSETGLCLAPQNKITEFIGTSPFDLKNQQLWYLPEDAIEGNSPNFADCFSTIIPDIINATNGGILFLATSNKNMNIIYDICSAYITYNSKNIKVLKQGNKSAAQLSQEFQNDKDSILVATKSFFTGIDIQGDSLRCVVIDKLPFPNISDPVMIRLQEEPGSFIKYSVPMMIIMLKQAIGRGVRTITDKCVIAFCDKRMKTARYAGAINLSFNHEKTATRNIEDVAKFLL